MCIYCNTTNYRKIYENHYGSIPKEEDGRTYEIHHIDGNHSNNDPSNLVAITIQEHYNIHYAQHDYYACYLIANQRMNKTPQEISDLAKANVKKQLESGKHPGKKRADGSCNAVNQLKNGTHPWQRRKDGTSIASDLVKAGKHPWQTQPDGSSLTKIRATDPNYVNPFSKREDGTSVSSDMVKEGTHHLLGKNHSAENNPSYDNTLYIFKHKVSGEVIEMTQYYFAKKYNHNKSNVNAMIKGRKSCGGWVRI